MKNLKLAAAVGAAVALLGAGFLTLGHASEPALKAQTPKEGIDLTDLQLKSVKVAGVAERAFVTKREAVGTIAFNDEKTVQVYSPYQGKITEVFAKAGDEVEKGTPLFAINSPDLVQAESALVAAAGTRELTTHALERAKKLLAVQGIAQKDYQQAVSDQQSADGAYNAAKNAVRIFDIKDSEIDRIIEKRAANPVYTIRSPINGLVTARNAAAGLLVQPGNPPAPFAVSDVSSMWMVANVAESDIPLIATGQEVEVSVMAFPGRVFKGRIINIGAAVDPNTHRVQVRSEVKDPNHEFKAGMFATFSIHLGKESQFPGVPLDSVTRESDGTMSVWVTKDRHHFTKRTVKVGLQQDGWFQITNGLQPGELVATEGAIFLSNTLITEAR